jgi:tetratricopeptide (TPR) repeat protein
MAAAYDQAAAFDKAEPLYRQLLEEAQQQPRPEDPSWVGIWTYDRAHAQAQLGRALLGQKKWADAERELRQAVGTYEPDHGTYAFEQASARSMLGGALAGQGRFAEAEPLLLEGYRDLKANEPHVWRLMKPRVPEAAERLEALYTAWGKPAEAAKWRAERAKYPATESPRPRP